MATVNLIKLRFHFPPLGVSEKGLHRNTGWEFLLLPQYGHQFVKGKAGWTALAGSTTFILIWYSIDTPTLNIEHLLWSSGDCSSFSTFNLGECHSKNGKYVNETYFLFFTTASHQSLNMICIIFEFPRHILPNEPRNYDICKRKWLSKFRLSMMHVYVLLIH